MNAAGSSRNASNVTSSISGSRSLFTAFPHHTQPEDGHENVYEVYMQFPPVFVDCVIFVNSRVKSAVIV